MAKPLIVVSIWATKTEGRYHLSVKYPTGAARELQVDTAGLVRVLKDVATIATGADSDA